MSRSERAHPRFAHSAAIAIRAPDAAPAHGTTKNVSRGGVCASFDQPINVGADVVIDLQLVFDEGTQSEPLQLPARVVWCTVVDDEHQVGISFRPLDAELSEYLTMFLRYLDDGSKPVRSKRESTLDKRFG